MLPEEMEKVTAEFNRCIASRLPIVSLESQQLWLLGLLPLSRTQMILGKFLFALTITLAAALGVMGISVLRLQLSGPLAGAHLIASVAACLRRRAGCTACCRAAGA